MRYAFIAPFAAVAMLGLGPAAPALAQDPSATVVRDGDGALTCVQMADEAAELSARMGEAGGGGLLGRVRAVAETGAATLVPGAGLAMAGMDALTTSNAERREVEAKTDRDRWNYLNGLYAGRRCDAPSDQAVSRPPETPPAAVSAPAISAGLLLAPPSPPR